MPCHDVDIFHLQKISKQHNTSNHRHLQSNNSIFCKRNGYMHLSCKSFSSTAVVSQCRLIITTLSADISSTRTTDATDKVLQIIEVDKIYHYLFQFHHHPICWLRSITKTLADVCIIVQQALSDSSPLTPKIITDWMGGQLITLLQFGRSIIIKL